MRGQELNKAQKRKRRNIGNKENMSEGETR